MQNSRLNRRQGFTIIELLVALGIIALLMALVIPAVMQSRGAAQKVTCKNNLKQLGIAVGAYETTHGVFPPGTTRGYSAFAFLLPFFDQSALYDEINFAVAPKTNPRVDVRLPLLLCPSDSGVGSMGNAPTCYAMNFGTGVQKYNYNGFFRHWVQSGSFKRGPVRVADVRDGLSNTAAFGETLVATGQQSRLRTVWTLPAPLTASNQYEAFASACQALTAVSGSDNTARGRPWAYGEISHTGYTHILGPNKPNCYNGNFVQQGSYSAGSEHSAGAHVLFADGRVEFVASDVSLDVWRDIGSIDGGH